MGACLSALLPSFSLPFLRLFYPSPNLSIIDLLCLQYSTNGAGTVVGALLVWGLSHVKHSSLFLYQLVFLVGGGLTLLFVPFVYFFLDESPATAKFLSEEDRAKAVERLKANKTVSVNNQFGASCLFSSPTSSSPPLSPTAQL
jgi:hypothetical protein